MEDYNLDNASSSTLQDNNTLSPEVWIKKGESYTMKPEIHERLIEIANDFYEFLRLDIELLDITLTGSLSNYNYSKYSDFDLHLIVDYDKVDADHELVDDFFNMKKTIWNTRHDITIKDFDVEVYAQDVNEPHHSTGVYSVKNEEWIVEPKKEEVNVDKNEVYKKSKSWSKQIDNIEKFYKKGKYDKVIGLVDKLKEKLKNYRSIGLDKKGEYAIENLVFKVLRRSGYIGRLNDMKEDSYDEKMTIKEYNKR
tara:strand:+ start:1270 stop:2025 length:756 start_codon:yes stop_codon:yes gene_type:complete